MPLRSRTRDPATLKRPAPRARQGMSKLHTDRMHDLLCLGCGREPHGWVPVCCHHLITGMVAAGERGQGMKAADRYAVPLCVACHDEQTNGSVHNLGSDELFFAPRGIDPRAIAEALWRARDDFPAMWRIVFRARQEAVRVVFVEREWRAA